MTFVVAFLFAFVLSVIYIFSIKSLAKKVKEQDPNYWQEIIQEKVFGRGEELGVFNKLYSRSMTVACERIGESRLLRLVRVLFPVTAILNMTLIAAIVWLHENS